MYMPRFVNLALIFQKHIGKIGLKYQYRTLWLGRCGIARNQCPKLIWRRPPTPSFSHYGFIRKYILNDPHLYIYIWIDFKRLAQRYLWVYLSYVVTRTCVVKYPTLMLKPKSILQYFLCRFYSLSKACRCTINSYRMINHTDRIALWIWSDN